VDKWRAGRIGLPSVIAYYKLTSLYKWRQDTQAVAGLGKFSCVPLGLIEIVEFS
jgi:hypothetical protein